MSAADLLQIIKPVWLKRVSQTMARGSQAKEDLEDQFELFFNQLEQAIETGDPAWFDSLLNTWALSLTQSDLEGTRNNLTEFVKELSLLTYHVCVENLEPDQSVKLMDSLLPVLVYILEKSSQFETESKVGYVTRQLDQVRMTLEKLDHSKSGFIAVAAHELKTPLTLVEGYAAMLDDTLKETKPDDPAIIYIQGIQKGTKRLKELIDDMIDVSLIDNNLMSMNFQPFWLNRLFDVLFHDISENIKERNLEFTIHNFDGFRELNYGDPERILQVFRNLITNAIKYTPDGGKIDINGRKLPGFIEVQINDTGIGIAPEDQTIIFEKFSRLGDVALHSSSKTNFKGGGPGLGLHIAKGIIEAHGGAIWVESAGYDENTFPGSTFHVLLPSRETPPDDKTAVLFRNLNQKGKINS